MHNIYKGQLGISIPNTRFNKITPKSDVDPLNTRLKVSTNMSQIFPSNDNNTSNTFTNNYDLWNAGLNNINSLVTGIFGDKDEYQGEKGAITQGLDSTYDTIQNVAGSLGPVGQLVSLGMGANELVGNVLNNLGGGTDGMTTTDAILGSSFLSLTPFGLINGFGGKKAATITKDNDAFETVGTSYTGTEQTVNDALSKSGKKYGLFSNGARKKANRQIYDARKQQEMVGDISDEATNKFAIRNSMSAINGNRRNYLMQGGYNQSNIHIGRRGLKLELLDRARQIVKNLQSKKFQEGGKVAIPTEILLVNPNEIPEFQKGGQLDAKSRTLEELIQYAKKVNPRFVQRMSEPLKYVEWDDDSGHHFGTHELGYTEMDGKYFVFPNIQEKEDGSLIRYSPENWRQAVDNAYKNKNGLFLNTEEEAKLFTESGQNPDGTFYGYKSGWPEFFKQNPAKYQNGGSMNVIPEGALHARKHNMDIDGITKKGIPVVSENKNGEMEQQAEIEKEEIIFRLEVTKKLEELQKKYYQENTSQKDKDALALEAGKLLVNEIIYNTVDNTNNLL